MNDDINTDFLEDPSGSVEEYYESVEDLIDETLDVGQDVEYSDETFFCDDEAASTPLSLEEQALPETVDPSTYYYNRSDGLDIYGDDVQITSIDRVESAVPYALNEDWGDTGVYDVLFGGMEYKLLFPCDVLDYLAVRNGILYNVSSQTIYAAVLNSVGDNLVGDTIFVFNPVASTTGVQNSLRYGGYSYRRTYVQNNVGGSYTGNDSYGIVSVVEEPPLFSGKPLAPYVFFGAFILVAILIFKRLFRRRTV